MRPPDVPKPATADTVSGLQNGLAGELDDHLIAPSHTKTQAPRRLRRQAALRLIAADANRREIEQIELANHLAHLGGRHVLEAMREVRRGRTILAVLEDFQRLPRWRGLRVVGVSP